MGLIRRLLYLFRQRREAADLAEEMEFHRRMLEQETGDPSAAARRMGGTLRAQEESRGIWLAAWMESVAQDLRYGWRSLVANPAFTAMALLALVMAIGLDTSLFAFFNALALRPWPVRDPNRVVTIFAASAARRRPGGFSIPEFRYLKEHSRTLSGAFVMRHEQVTLDRQEEGAKTSCQFVSGDYFSVLGVDMAMGRGFAEDEDLAETPRVVAVLNYRTWKTRYGGDPNIIGRRIDVNDIPFFVVGVASEDFPGTAPGPSDLWLPMATMALTQPNNPDLKTILANANWCCSDVAGRLAAGATHRGAEAELTTLATQYQAERREDPQTVIVAGTQFLSNPTGKRVAVPVISLLSAAVGAILLLACANVSNLMLARASARQREIAVRLAIGASRMRVVRQLLTESLMLAGIASAIGLAVAAWLPRFVLMQAGDEVPPFRVTPNVTVLAFTVAIAFVVAIAFGLVPALRATQVSVSDAMKQQGGHGSPRFPLRGVLLGIQVAISVTLLVAAGLLTRGLVHARQVDPGFQVSGVAVVTVDLPVGRYDQARGRAFFQDLMQRLGPLSVSGKVGFTALAPLGNGRTLEGLPLPGQRDSRPVAVFRHSVNPEFFEVLGIPILTGRMFTPGDAERHSILINETMAQRYWPEQNPLGQRIGDYEVVGVVRDAQLNGLGPAEPAFFRLSDGGQRGVLLLKGNGDDSRWVKQIAGVVRDGEARAVVSVIPMPEQLDRWLGSSRMSAALAAALGALALLLAAVGVYGVVAYSVEQRRREIGIRMALGARSGQIMTFVARSNSRALAVGLAAGLLLSLAASKVLETSLYGVSRLDPLAYGGVLLVMLAAGIAASIVPARRAASIAPLEALHYE